MGLFGKIKNILFDEEEIEIPVNDKKVVKEEKKAPLVEPPKLDLNAKVNNQVLNEEDPIGGSRQKTLQSLLDDSFLDKPNKTFMERDEELMPRITEEQPKDDLSFHFPSFDEKDYESPARELKTNVVTVEKEKNIGYDKYTITKKEETVIEKKLFKPSPIISPVYGIMDKNYKKEDVYEKPKKGLTREQQKSVDIDSIRKKAYGTLEDDIESRINSSIDELYDELDMPSKAKPIETLDKDELTTPIKTIDELLIDSMNEESSEKKKEKFEKASDLNETFKLDEVINEMKKASNKLSNDDELFKLIDSMYEERNDEE